jgi:hypothetical protein
MKATASSVDGRRFTFQCSVRDLGLQPGGYVSIGPRLGQVHSIERQSRKNSWPRIQMICLELDKTHRVDASRDLATAKAV